MRLHRNIVSSIHQQSLLLSLYNIFEIHLCAGLLPRTHNLKQSPLPRANQQLKQQIKATSKSKGNYHVRAWPSTSQLGIAMWARIWQTFFTRAWRHVLEHHRLPITIYCRHLQRGEHPPNDISISKRILNHTGSKYHEKLDKW